MSTAHHILLLCIACSSSARFQHFPTTSGRSDNIGRPSSAARPTGRPGLGELYAGQAEATQGLLQLAGNSFLDRGSLNPRKRAKEVALLSVKTPEADKPGVNIGEYAEERDKTVKTRPVDQTSNLRPPGKRKLENTSETISQRPRKRVRMGQKSVSDKIKPRTRSEIGATSRKPPPPKSRFTILRSSGSREGILVSNRQNILVKEGKSKKKITLLEDSFRRNPLNN